MYNSEALFYTENDFSTTVEDELEGLFDNGDALVLSGASDESFLTEEMFDEDVFYEEELEIEEEMDETIFGSEEANLFFDEDETELVNLVNKINFETAGMNENEATDYMEDKMEEFLPALAAALPTIIQLAPAAISAIGSLFSKKSPANNERPVQPARQVVPATPASSTPAPSNIVSQNVQGGAGSTQVIRVLSELIQSPGFLQLLSGMLAGNPQTVTANNGQQISGSNILGVISSLAGAIAGGNTPSNTESFFPEYTMNGEGTFLIDPHDALQEAQLILELIN